ncbi:hypothetical protein [Methylobacterium sp. NEAU K]|nr:hypothetical protein [Methylobacterium sp. NEAU K]MDP4005513.1 hypothetical protein [Methylobacterium sp. NEAU K]
MRIRKEATYDGVWTVFVGEGLCFSDLTEPAADALVAAFARLGADRD